MKMMTPCGSYGTVGTYEASANKRARPTVDAKLISAEMGHDPAALRLRQEWMRRMKLSEEEIEESCRHDPPVDFGEEVRQLEALLRAQEKTPPRSELARRATKF